MAPLGGFAMSLFFLIVYNAGIGGIGNLDVFAGKGYLSFLFPLTIISLAMGSSSGAGQTLNTDMQSGYFRRLYFSPASRWSLVIAPMIADTLSSLVFTAILIAIGALFGITFQFGILSVLGILLISLLWALTLCGFSAGIMIRTGQYQSASIVTNAVFPLLFLSTTFLPRITDIQMAIDHFMGKSRYLRARRMQVFVGRNFRSKIFCYCADYIYLYVYSFNWLCIIKFPKN